MKTCFLPLPITSPHLSAGTAYVTSCSPPGPPMLQSPRPRRPIIPPKPSRSYTKGTRRKKTVLERILTWTVYLTGQGKTKMTVYGGSIDCHFIVIYFHFWNPVIDKLTVLFLQIVTFMLDCNIVSSTYMLHGSTNHCYVSQNIKTHWLDVTGQTKLKHTPEQFEPVHWWGGPRGGSGRAGPSPEQLCQDWLHHLENKNKAQNGLQLLKCWIQFYFWVLWMKVIQ